MLLIVFKRNSEYYDAWSENFKAELDVVIMLMWWKRVEFLIIGNAKLNTSRQERAFLRFHFDSSGNVYSFRKYLIYHNNEAFNHAHNTFKSDENETEIDRINSMNIAKKSKKQLKLQVVQTERDRVMIK